MPFFWYFVTFLFCFLHYLSARPDASASKRWNNSKFLQIPSDKDAPDSREKKGSDFHWSGQNVMPYMWNQHNVPYQGKGPWTWGDGLNVQVNENDDVQLLPVGLPVRLPNGGYHQSNVIVRKPNPGRPQYVQQPDPVRIPSDSFSNIVNSLYTPVVQEPPRPLTPQTVSFSKPIEVFNEKPLTIGIQDSDDKHIVVQGSGGQQHKDDKIGSTLTVLDPDNADDMTLLHGSILVSKKRKPLIPVPQQKPAVAPQSEGPLSLSEILAHIDEFPSHYGSSNVPPVTSQTSSTNSFLQQHPDLFSNVPGPDDNLSHINSLTLTQTTDEGTTETPIDEIISTTPSFGEEDHTLIDKFISANVASTDDTIPTSDDSGPLPDDLEPYLVPDKHLVLPQVAEEEPVVDTTENYEPEVQALFASVNPPASQSVVSSQFLGLPPVAAATTNSFTNVPSVSSFSTNNAINTATGNAVSTGSALQFVVQILIPIIIVMGIVYFFFIVTTSGRRRRRDLSDSSLESLLKLPQGFPLELLGR